MQCAQGVGGHRPPVQSGLLIQIRVSGLLGKEVCINMDWPLAVLNHGVQLKGDVPPHEAGVSVLHGLVERGMVGDDFESLPPQVVPKFFNSPPHGQQLFLNYSIRLFWGR